MAGLEVRVGTSGFHYAHWRGTFYPEELQEREWLGYYARHFDTVELNATFYRLPTARTFQGWRERVPPGFTFSVKGSRLITHLKRLHDPVPALEQLLERARHLGDRLGPLLYQLPPGMERDTERLEGFLEVLPTGFRHVMEFRNASWYVPEVLAALERHNVALCVHDMMGSASPLAATADVVYARFHGPEGYYSGSYDDASLERWANNLARLAQGRTALYAYFNNDVGGHAVQNARTLRDNLVRRLA